MFFQCTRFLLISFCPSYWLFPLLHFPLKNFCTISVYAWWETYSVIQLQIQAHVDENYIWNRFFVQVPIAEGGKFSVFRQVNKALHSHQELRWEPRQLSLIKSGIVIQAEAHLLVKCCIENQDTFVTWRLARIKIILK